MKSIKSYLYIIFLFALLYACTNSADVAPQVGQGGSMARFAIQGDYLYTLNTRSLQVYDLKNNNTPTFKKAINLGTGIETIFPYQNMLFIGSETGMLILDNANPYSPKLISTYSHIQSCDPVVVQGNYAYVTLRRGTTCRQGLSELDIVDISDLKKPTLVSTYPMFNPMGLGIDGENLFICDGAAGLKGFKLENPIAPTLNFVHSNIQAYDVIPRNGLLLMIGENGLYQYSYKGENMELLSTIPVNQQ